MTMDNNPQNLPTDSFDPREMQSIAYVIYAVYVLGMLAQFSLFTFLPGCAAIMCAAGYAHIKRVELKDTIFENHYRWLTRTFWIGGAVLMPAATVVLSIYQIYMIDMTPLYNAMREGEHDVQKLMELLYENNMRVIFVSFVVTLSLFTIWWLGRCLRGVWYLRKMQAVPDVTRWL
jgi:uncharacterized membrane protein